MPTVGAGEVHGAFTAAKTSHPPRTHRHMSPMHCTDNSKDDALIHLGDNPLEELQIHSNSSALSSSLSTTVIEGVIVSEGKMDVFPNIDKKTIFL